MDDDCGGPKWDLWWHKLYFLLPLCAPSTALQDVPKSLRMHLIGKISGQELYKEVYEMISGQSVPGKFQQSREFSGHRKKEVVSLAKKTNRNRIGESL